MIKYGEFIAAPKVKTLYKNKLTFKYEGIEIEEESRLVVYALKYEYLKNLN